MLFVGPNGGGPIFDEGRMLCNREASKSKKL